MHDVPKWEARGWTVVRDADGLMRITEFSAGLGHETVVVKEMGMFLRARLQISEALREAKREIRSRYRATMRALQDLLS